MMGLNHLTICRCLLLFWFFAFLLVSGCSQSHSEKPDMVTIKLGEETISVEIAATQEARKKGLMYRKELAPDTGMLFVYPDEKIRHFYMKNTYIPLDIAFIDKAGVIVDIQQMKPLDETIIRSKEKARYALEANRGFFRRIGGAVGDKIAFTGAAPTARH